MLHRLRHDGGGLLEAARKALPPLSAAKKILPANKPISCFIPIASITRAIGQLGSRTGGSGLSGRTLTVPLKSTAG